MSETLWVKCGRSFTVFVNLPTATINTLDATMPVSRAKSGVIGLAANLTQLGYRRAGVTTTRSKMISPKKSHSSKCSSSTKAKGGGQSEGKHGNMLELPQVITTVLMFLITK